MGVNPSGQRSFETEVDVQKYSPNSPNDVSDDLDMSGRYNESLEESRTITSPRMAYSSMEDVE
jgi:hypothetical protein